MSIFSALLLLTTVVVYFAQTESQIRRFSVLMSTVTAVSIIGVALLALINKITLSIGGLFKADEFSLLFVILISFCYLTATIVSYRYINVEYGEKIISLNQVRLYFCLLPIFILSMLMTVLADNLGILWIGLEGTTLATTLLVAMYRGDAAIEAAWKYIILCSIGISLGLLGMMIFIYTGVTDAGLFSFTSLSFSSLQNKAEFLNHDTIRYGFIFIFIGLGTKVGFVPMHTWLPDAHSKTPSPISALLSGILLNIALYSILRFKSIVDISLSSEQWTDHIFLAFGVLSVTVASLFLLQQRNYKRMLAYSSIEHMGIMAFAISLGPIGLVAALLHTIAHTLTKPLLFFGAGEILLSYRTTKIEGVRNVMRKLPITGTLTTLGLLMILAVPPSALFTSEFMTLGLGLQQHPWLSSLILISLSIATFSMLHSVITMLYGQENDRKVFPKEKWNITHSVMSVQLILIIITGLLATTPQALQVLNNIAKSI